MADHSVIAQVVLDARHEPTGGTRHFYGAPGGEQTPVPAPVSLAIATYPGDSGFYLFYCDADGHELTDTWHETEGDAMGQAEFEFGVKPDEWSRV